MRRSAWAAASSIEKVVVYKRTGGEVTWNTAHDIWWHD
jgi:acetyl-CoA synthetase